MGTSPQMQREPSQDSLTFPLSKLVSIITLAALIGSTSISIAATYIKASQAAEEVRRLDENTVKRDEMKELKDDVREMRQDLHRYIEQERRNNPHR